MTILSYFLAITIVFISLYARALLTLIKRYKVSYFLLRYKLRFYKNKAVLLEKINKEILKNNETHRLALKNIHDRYLDILMAKLYDVLNSQNEMFEKIMSVSKLDNKQLWVIKSNFISLESEKNRIVEEIIVIGADPEINFFSNEVGGSDYKPMSVYKNGHLNDFIEFIFAGLNKRFQTSIFSFKKEESLIEEPEDGDNKTSSMFFSDLLESFEDKESNLSKKKLISYKGRKKH